MFPQVKELVDFLEKFRKELEKESDCGSMLISMAMLDDLLRKIIKAFLISGSNAPIVSFSSRIALAYALGIISEEEHDECNSLRTVRNEFAHNIFRNFEDQKVKDICANLHFAPKYTTNPPNLPRVQFLTSAMGLIIALSFRLPLVAKSRLVYQSWP